MIGVSSTRLRFAAQPLCGQKVSDLYFSDNVLQFTFQLHNSANPWNSFAGYRREIHTFLWNAQPTQDFTNGAIYNEGKRCLNVGGVRGKKSEKSKNLLAVLCV